jgi:hypothetical protein
MYGPSVVDATTSNPVIQQALNERQALVTRIQIMEKYGFGLQAMALIPQIRAIDLGLTKAQGDQGVYEGNTTGNWSRAMEVLSYMRQTPHQTLDRGDGTNDLYVGGKLFRTGMTADALTTFIRSTTDTEFQKQKAALAGEQYKTQLKIQEIVATETLKAQGNLQTALLNAQAELVKQGVINRKAQLLQLADGKLALYEGGKISIIDPAATATVRGQANVPAPTRTVVP